MLNLHIGILTSGNFPSFNIFIFTLVAFFSSLILDLLDLLRTVYFFVIFFIVIMCYKSCSIVNILGLDSAISILIHCLLKRFFNFFLTEGYTIICVPLILRSYDIFIYLFT
jgi:hypothetical protein